MLTGKYIPATVVVDSMFNQYGFNPQDIHELDIYEHIYDAMSLIAVPLAFTRKIARITIVNYRGELPCDLHSVEDGGIRLATTGTPLVYSASVFYNSDSIQIGTTENLIPENPVQITVDGISSTIKDFDSDIENLVSNTAAYDLTYSLNNNYIIVGFSSGEIDMSYRAFPSMVLCEGCKPIPAIPDHIRYIMAVKSYVAERIAYYLWNKDLLSDKKYVKYESERLWYMASAQIITPSYDKMESISAQSMNMIPDYTKHSRYFGDLHRVSALKTQNYGRTRRRIM